LNTVRLSRRQHGAIARRQMLERGMSRRQIDGMLARNQLVVVLPGVYRFAAAPVTERQMQWAALLWAGPEAVLSHCGAATLWSLEGVVAPRPEFWCPRQLRSPLVVAHRGSIPNRDKGRLFNLPVTSPSRTLFDLATTVEEIVLECAIEDARRRRLVDDQRLQSDLERFSGRGRAGSTRYRRVLNALAGTEPCESVLEVKVARLLRAANISSPVRQ
jgi:hypothetical protein